MNAITDTVIFSLAIGGPLRLLWDAWSWLTSPTVFGWMGIVAAIVAAFAVSPRQWVSSPIAFFGRCVCVVIAWVAVVLILSAVIPGSSGVGSGAGEATEQEASVGDDALPAEGSGTVVVKPLNNSDATRIGDDIIVRFIASQANPALAQPYACDLLLKLPQKPSVLIEIRSSSMSELIEQFASQLKENELHSYTANVSVRIEMSPYPGEPVIQKLKQLCRDANPNCDFVLGE